MINQEVVNDLVFHGYNSYLEEFDGLECVMVDICVDENNLTLFHLLPKEITKLPVFYVMPADILVNLSHLFYSPKNDIYSVCVTTQDSISLNFNCPLLVIRASLERHISLITRAIQDPVWNKQELLREFSANWSQVCDLNAREFICASENGGIEAIEVLGPQSRTKYGFSSHFMGISASSQALPDFSLLNRYIRYSKRAVAGRGLILPMGTLHPAPKSTEGIEAWYLEALANISTKTKEQFTKKYALYRCTEYWIIFNACTPSGKTWFGIYFKTNKKRCLPTTKEHLKKWKLKAIRAKVFNKESVMPRSGANVSLNEKNVLLVGCGSVGGEIAQKLGSSGIGRIVLSDPDIFSIDNLYRHVLNGSDIGFSKTMALGNDLDLRFPWLLTSCFESSLLELRDKNLLKHIDLIIISIGSPTHERIFWEFIQTIPEPPAVINSWLEGLEIGGHATIDIPSSPGCLNCAYIDTKDYSRGLASNLNFIESNQDVTINYAGCGELFLPYSGLSASKTAIIAADLAIKYLSGKLNKSSKISWKGDMDEAASKGIQLTHRYYHFDKSLQILPLRHEACDVCY